MSQITNLLFSLRRATFAWRGKAELRPPIVPSGIKPPFLFSTVIQDAEVAEHLAEEISIHALADLVEMSSSHFSHVFKYSTGMTPLQFVTRQRITRAQQLIRETSSSLINVGLDVGYTSPSHFAQVFRRVVGVTPTKFRSSL